MFPVIRNNNTSLIALNGTSGLNGWFGKLVKGLIGLALGAVGEIPIVGGMLQAELTKKVDDWTNSYGGSFWARGGTPEFEPDDLEAAIIKNWATSKMIPFYKVLANQVSAAFANNNIDVQLAEINNATMKMCVLKKYFATNETAGLSPDAVLSRMEFITQIFLPVEDLIAKSVAAYETVIKQQDYTVTIAATHESQFKKIAFVKLGTAYQCKQYVDTNLPNTKPVGSNPTTPVLGQDPTTPVNQVPGTTPTTPTPNKSLFSPKNILFALLAGWGIIELTKDDKKKKK